MIGIDANLLVYALREDSPWHQRAVAALTELAEGTAPWAIPWPCAHEYLSVATHPRIYRPPTPLEVAVDALGVWLASPSVVLLAEGEGYWPLLVGLLREGRIVGPRVHDARIAALCQLHAVRELWTADRDFSRFPGLRVRNPLIG